MKHLSINVIAQVQFAFNQNKDSHNKILDAGGRITVLNHFADLVTGIRAWPLPSALGVLNKIAGSEPYTTKHMSDHQ